MSTNLSLLARSYLMVRPNKRDFENRSMVANLPQSVPFLLQEAVQICKEFNPLSRLRDVPAHQIGGEAPRYLWSLYVVDPCVRDIFEIVRTGGDPAIDALVRGLYDDNHLVKIVSSLVLLEIDKPNNRLNEQLERFMDYIKLNDREKPYYKPSVLLAIVMFILYKGGAPSTKIFVEDMLRKENIGFAFMVSRWRNTMLNYLFSETGINR